LESYYTFIISIVVSIFLAWKVFPYFEKRCPECGGRAFSLPSNLNTSDGDYTYHCRKCKHKWYRDNTTKFFNK